jgi:NAD-dependent SIR2 family protein deacetylase
MPTSVTPPPGENEVECANCGAYIHIELTRCPNCGVNLYEPEEDRYAEPAPRSEGSGAWSKVTRALRRLFGEQHPAEALFESALREKALYDDLLLKVGGDRSVADRLIAFERERTPTATRMTCLQNAIRRWEREN